MPLRYQRRLLDHLAHERYAPADAQTLAQDLGIPDEELTDFKEAVDALAASGSVVVDGRGLVRLPPMPDRVTGRFKKNERGFGFVKPDRPYREGDLFIPPDATGDALTGDTVSVEVVRGRGRGGERDTTGEIVEVLERKRSSFTGELVKRGGMWLVLPDGREMTRPIVVKDPAVKNAAAGDKVAVEITRYPTEPNELAEGVIAKVLGEAGLPDVETQAIIIAYGLPGEFPRECVEQARAAAAGFEEEVARFEKQGYNPRERLDLRAEFICTIDPPDAKDYDDAISIRRTDAVPGGGSGWELGVHIADVAHFIPHGSALDEEAAERGNSVYLPRLVIPMLPEVLSNGICSLAEGVVRFCKSAFMTYDEHGKVRSERCASTAIRSAKRLTYLEAQALIDGDLREARKHAKTEPKYTDELIRAVREMDRLARVIRERRRKAGMIHLDLPEVNLIFDDAGHVVDAEPEDNAFTHTVIEMFMVEANEVLARLFEGMAVPLLRRVHPDPTPGDVQDLRMAAKVAGFNIPKSPTRQELQALLDATAGTAAARAVHTAVLRTLTRAEYSPALIGHFALASSAYAHFTSPIRRYPDLTVHRALAEYLRQTDNGQNRPKAEKERRALGRRIMDKGRERGVMDFDQLVEIGRRCSETEKNAEAAEYSLRQFLVLQLLSAHVGEAFPGIVTGVAGAGVFVQLDKYLADGMIKAADLPVGHGQTGGRWSVDQRTGALVHPPSGRSFTIGDKVQVTIANIDLALRKMDLVITEGKSREAGKAKRVEPRRPERDETDEPRPRTTGADKRAARSKQRDKAKAEHRPERKKKRRR